MARLGSDRGVAGGPLATAVASVVVLPQDRPGNAGVPSVGRVLALASIPSRP